MVETAKKWIGITLVSVLVIGVGLGVLLDRLLLAPTVFSDLRDGRRGERQHGEHVERMVQRLHSRLDLNADQRDRLEQVMTRNHETARGFWKDSRAEYQALRQQFRQDIRGLLTEDQKVLFDEMVREYDSKRSHSPHRGRE